MAMPTMALYSASKFALEGISEALYYEMIPWGIKVTLVQPGFVRSNSFKNVLVSDAAREAVESSSTYANYYYHMGRFIARLMNRATATPEKIAERADTVEQLELRGWVTLNLISNGVRLMNGFADAPAKTEGGGSGAWGHRPHRARWRGARLHRVVQVGSKQVRSGSNLGDSSRRAELALKRFTYHLAQRAAAATARRARRLEPFRGGVFSLGRPRRLGSGEAVAGANLNRQVDDRRDRCDQFPKAA